MRQLLFLFLCFSTIFINAQGRVYGIVTDTDGNPVIGANIFIKGSYDGASTNEKGAFEFYSNEKGLQTLIISCISFETKHIVSETSKMKNLQITLNEEINTLDAVVINATNFEAGDNAKKVAALKSLDIVTTAGAMGDTFGAFQTLPGTSSNEEDGRLFVRGGNPNETQIYIDGIHVGNPYIGSFRNTPTRSRFSPMLFKGTSFSTGGYSAEYGQALSGILSMNSIDNPQEEKTNINIMSVGASLGNTQIWNKNALTFNIAYTNLTPYNFLLPTKQKQDKPYESINGEIIYRYKPNDDGLLKIYGSISNSSVQSTLDNINYKNGFLFGFKNLNTYGNTSYQQKLENNWSLHTGISFTYNKSEIQLNKQEVHQDEKMGHLKLKISKKFNNYFKINSGIETFISSFDEKFTTNNVDYKTKFDNTLLGSYIEGELFINKKLATKIGVRAENNSRINQSTISPRASIAYKVSKKSQISFNYGKFEQNPAKEVLKYSNRVKSEKSQHYILNYQFVKNKQILRIDAYYKKYNSLIKHHNSLATYAPRFSNQGYGYAKGIDFFWRDNYNFKNLEYWVSYSYLDTKRDYKAYPELATPNFVSKHNFSIVGKYWLHKLNTLVGVTHNFNSGRSYTNPNTNGFLNQKTPCNNTTSINASYLISQQKILYLSVGNLFNNQNIYNYRYKNIPDNNGVYERQAMIANTERVFFIGFFWTISKNKKSNQLNSL